MRSNDKIPKDEMLLAEALAATQARGLKWCKGAPFRVDGMATGPEYAEACCALGALYLAGRASLSKVVVGERRKLAHGLTTQNVWYGNDSSGWWETGASDSGESLGWAFRCAMTQDDQ